MRNFSDQTLIFNPDTWGWPVHLIGAGGINNLVGPLLAKTGITEIHVWDNDELEVRNCPTEIAYSYQSVGYPKTAAMAEAIYRLTEPEYSPDFADPGYLPTGPVHVHQHQRRISALTPGLSGVVICGVDSMASRKEIWKNIKANFHKIPLYIDGRSGGEQTMLFTFSPVDFECADAYENGWLYDDDEVATLPCGARNIGYISAYLAADITRIITRFHRGLPIEFYTPKTYV